MSDSRLMFNAFFLGCAIVLFFIATTEKDFVAAAIVLFAIFFGLYFKPKAGGGPQ
jgi:hypothetical protein